MNALLHDFLRKLLNPRLIVRPVHPIPELFDEEEVAVVELGFDLAERALDFLTFDVLQKELVAEFVSCCKEHQMPSEDNSAHSERQEEDNPENDVGFFVDDVPGQNAQRIIRLEGTAGAKLPPEAFGHLRKHLV